MHEQQLAPVLMHDRHTIGALKYREPVNAVIFRLRFRLPGLSLFHRKPRYPKADSNRDGQDKDEAKQRSVPPAVAGGSLSHQDPPATAGGTDLPYPDNLCPFLLIHFL